MYIHQLPNEIKETIFLKVYERQCYTMVVTNKLIRTLFEMLWAYTNPLARSVVWKWLVWFVHDSLYPEALTWKKDEVYVRFREWIRKSYETLYGTREGLAILPSSPLKLTIKWYNIEKKINRQLRIFLKRKNRDQVETHILSIHGCAGMVHYIKRRKLILDFRQRFPRPFFMGKECDECGVEDGLITYPCKHTICTSCFTKKVRTFSRQCLVCFKMECLRNSACGTLKQKGWNHYVRKHCPNFKDYKKCARCRYYRPSKDIIQTNLCENCYSLAVNAVWKRD